MTPPNALVPASNGSARGVVSRCVLTIVVILLYGWINALLYPVAALATADQAGKQFQNNDLSAVTASYGMNVFGHLGIPLVVLLAVLVVIWWHPARRLLVPLTAIGILLQVLRPHPAAAYYDNPTIPRPILSCQMNPASGSPTSAPTKTARRSSNPKPI